MKFRFRSASLGFETTLYLSPPTPVPCPDARHTPPTTANGGEREDSWLCTCARGEAAGGPSLDAICCDFADSKSSRKNDATRQIALLMIGAAPIMKKIRLAGGQRGCAGMVRIMRSRLLLAPVLLVLMHSASSSCSALTTSSLHMHNDVASSALCSRLDQHETMQGCCAPLVVVAGCGCLKLRGGGGGVSHSKVRAPSWSAAAATDDVERDDPHRKLCVLGGELNTGMLALSSGKKQLKHAVQRDGSGDVSRLRGGGDVLSPGGQDTGMTDSHGEQVRFTLKTFLFLQASYIHSTDNKQTDGCKTPRRGGCGRCAAAERGGCKSVPSPVFRVVYV